MSLAYHSTEYLENQIETFKILLGKKDAEIASLLAQNELTHAAYVEENNHLMAEREALREALQKTHDLIEIGYDTEAVECARSELAAAKRELNDAEEARNDAETRLLASLADCQDADKIARLKEALENTTSILEDAQSGHIPGCGGDTEWLRSRDVAVKDARTALACHPQVDRNET